MANRIFYQFTSSLNKDLVLLECGFTVGASGAVGTILGSGISTITKLGSAGTYKIVLEDKYNKFLGFSSLAIPTVTGSNVNDGSLVANTLYQITAVGTSDFTLVGAARNEVGVTFVATGVGGAGTGTVKAVGISGIASVEVADTDIQNAVALGEGIIIQCLAATNSSTTTLIKTNPVQGTLLKFQILLRNSSVPGKGE